MFQSEKKLSGSTRKMSKADTWVINYFNNCFNLKRSCLVLLRRWTRQIPGSSTTLTNVSIWKEVVCFYSEDEQDRYLGHQLLQQMFQSEKKLSGSTQKMNRADTSVINYFNKCFNLKRNCLVLLRRWTRQIPESSINYFNKCFNLKRSCLVLLGRWTRQILGSSTTLTNVSIWKEVVWFYSEDEQDRYLGHQLL